MPTPQTKVWPLGYKTQSGVYSRLSSGVGDLLTDRRIAQYARKGFYGEDARLRQERLDLKSKHKTKQDKINEMIDELVD